VMGEVLQAGAGQIPSRQVSVGIGLGPTVGSETINKVCASGMRAATLADVMIRAGEHDVILAGGMESMSNAPYLLPKGRFGYGMGDGAVLDSMVSDGLTCTFDGLVMAEQNSKVAAEAGISREEQDAWALRSHERAVAAIDGGRFAEEIVPVTARLVDGRNGTRVQTSEIRFAVDEGPRRDTSREALAQLRPAFHVRGSVTAGNSSQMSDGAAAVIVVSGERARQSGLAPLGRFVAFATAGVEPERFGIGPVPAMRKVVKLAGLTMDQIDLVELNEAFAAQVLACLKEQPIDPDRLNVNGGAIALGHPLGCTGAKLTTTLLYEMKRRHVRYGMVTMCVGGGMGAAGIFERM
jgi:acetyl-CoA acetyltransferase family protein